MSDANAPRVMGESTNRSLIRRPIGSVGKTEPRPKRILRDMVAETLALAKNESCPKPLLRVLLGGDNPANNSVQLLIQFRFEARHSLEFNRFENENELLRLAEQPFDLIVVTYVYGIWSHGINRAVEVLTGLKAKYRKPIIAHSNWCNIDKHFEGTGVTYLELPYNMRTFWNALDGLLNNAKGDSA
jgi:hypothetical protein